MEIGIIGCGRFGKLAVTYLSTDFKVFVFDRLNKIQVIKDLKAIHTSLEEVCSKDIIIICVPISKFKHVLKLIKPMIKKGSLVIDICSVKEYPVQLMKKLLPAHAQILATHPLFGPDSVQDTLAGRKIALCKVRIKPQLYRLIKKYLCGKGLVIIETTPKKHDKEIAQSLLLTQLIGRTLLSFGVSELSIDTLGYKKLLEIVQTAKNDSWQLFADMNQYNRYSEKIRHNLIEALVNTNKRIEQ